MLFCRHHVCAGGIHVLSECHAFVGTLLAKAVRHHLSLAGSMCMSASTATAQHARLLMFIPCCQLARWPFRCQTKQSACSMPGQVYTSHRNDDMCHRDDAMSRTTARNEGHSILRGPQHIETLNENATAIALIALLRPCMHHPNKDRSRLCRRRRTCPWTLTWHSGEHPLYCVERPRLVGPCTLYCRCVHWTRADRPHVKMVCRLDGGRGSVNNSNRYGRFVSVMLHWSGMSWQKRGHVCSVG